MNSANIDQVIDSLHPFERECLSVMKQLKTTKISTKELMEKSNTLDLNKSNRAIQWLNEKGLFSITKEKKKEFHLTTIGKLALQKGLPELRLLFWLKDNKEISIKEASVTSGLNPQEFNVSLGQLKRTQWIEINKGLIVLTSKGNKRLEQGSKSEIEKILDQISQKKYKINKNNKKTIKELMNRGLVEEKVEDTVIIGSLTDFGLMVYDHFNETEDDVANLTAEMISDGSWKNIKIRPFPVDAPVPPVLAGKRHFYWQAIDYCRQLWLNLGFKEMEGPIVQTSFWNFDALFVPQDHPAREEQDTFFIKQPKSGKVPESIFHDVAEVHKNGGNTGSRGWGGNFSREISQSLTLRTHTTCLSAQTIYKLRKEGYPAKYFAVGRCFRNEKIDWNHLAEFDQVEGIVIDPDVTFQDLLGYLRVFFKAMGFPKARFTPSYYPYTEPSVGIEVFHPIKKVWFDLGGSGVFRPELVVPILGEDIPVLAWGPGIGRIIKETYNITDIRRQYENDIDQLRSAPIWLR